MKHKVYFTNSIEKELNPEYIGEFNTVKEMWDIVNPRLKHKERYCRFLLADDATYIDYGSYSTFLRVVPPITMQELEQSDTD